LAHQTLLVMRVLAFSDSYSAMILALPQSHGTSRIRRFI
jgi:hypothetical protein